MMFDETSMPATDRVATEAAPVEPVHSTGVVVQEGEVTNIVLPGNVNMIGDVPGDFTALQTVPSF